MKQVSTLGRKLQFQFVVVALVPILVAGLLAIFWLVPQVRQEIGVHHQDMARVVGSQVAIHLQGAERELHALADYLGIQIQEPEAEFTQVLDAHVGDSGLFEAIYLVQERNLIVAVGLSRRQASRRRDLLGMDLSRRDFLAQARETGRPMWSGNFLSTVSGKPAVAYVVPIGHWYLVGEVTIQSLTEYVSSLPSESHLVTLVLDGRGHVIAHSAPAFAGHQINLKKLFTLTRLSLGSANVFGFELEGRDYLGTVMDEERFGWRVLVAQQVDDALRPLRMALWALGLGVLAALVLALGAGWLFARGGSRDFKRYTDQARAIANGDYDRPWPSVQIKEFVNLGDDLQKMVHAIRERESRLAASEKVLRASQKAARLGNYSLDLASGQWESSAILDDILGVSPDFQRDRAGWLSLIHPDDREEMEDFLGNQLFKNPGKLDRQFRVIRQMDHEERWVHGLGRLESDDQGQPKRLIGTIQDITERKQLESQLLQSQKMDAIGQLAGGVAHDINNMLNVILGYTELMMLTKSPDSPDYEKLSQIEKAGNRSQEITRQLLAFSRKQIITPKPQNLNQLVQASVKTLSRLIGENVVLQFNPAQNLWLVKVDAAQIDQILVNLAVNARDAMPEGGKLLVETSNLTFDEDYTRHHVDTKPGDYVMLAVSDMGQGMSKETLAHIFEPFFTTKAVGKGTGLGLATVYGIVTQHGGFINVYSEVGRGTTFRIYMPRYWGDEQDEEVEKAAPPRRGSGRVLLVEDDPMVRLTTQAMLQELGYEVLAPDTAEQAVIICEQPDQEFDILVTDLIMPDMSGKDLWERVRTLQPGMSVLFISGYTNDVIVHHGVLDPGVHFLAKPFNLKDLATKVGQALDLEC